MTTDHKPSRLRHLWDSFRWRPVAAFYIAWWLLKGAPALPDDISTWEEVKTAWVVWRRSIMFEHERHSYIPIEELLAELKAEIENEEKDSRQPACHSGECEDR